MVILPKQIKGWFDCYYAVKTNHSKFSQYDCYKVGLLLPNTWVVWIAGKTTKTFGSFIPIWICSINVDLSINNEDEDSTKKINSHTQHEPSRETTSHYNLRSEKERKSLTTDGPHVKMPCFPNIFQNGERNLCCGLGHGRCDGNGIIEVVVKVAEVAPRENIFQDSWYTAWKGTFSMQDTCTLQVSYKIHATC